uniref:arsenate reductase/protein-tyrosine-phosphatase family protein n=1 Tax=Roseivirga sp. TaxID=1964215 RepID=UPI0040483793
MDIDKPEVLFICTGNYYRSRFCEMYYNHISQSKRADSKGLLADKGLTEGPLSVHTIGFLKELNIPFDLQRFPAQLEETHLLSTSIVIALCEREHRPLMEEQFPDWANKIIYWQVNDIDFTEPRLALPELKKMVEHLFQNR